MEKPYYNAITTRLKIVIIYLFSSVIISAQTNKTFFLGHSLMNFEIPNMVDKLSIASTQDFSYDANIGIGASLGWHWQSPSSGQGNQWDLTLPLGGYENFIITEAVPLENQLQYNTYRIVDSLYSFAKQSNPDIQYYIYETWHCTNSGNGSTSGEGGYPCSWDSDSNTPWRERINDDLPKWEGIANNINLSHSNPMLVIPGGQALGRLYDTIQSGSVPGLSSVYDLFVDEHHLDSRGNYFIACVMYSVIHGVSPVGLPHQLTNRFGNLYTVYPTPDLATIMQEVAWQTVCDYQRDGVECEAVALSSVEKETQSIKIYPVPTNELLTIEVDAFKEAAPYTILDQLGKAVLHGTLSSKINIINVDDLSVGLYFLSTSNQVIKFIK